MRRLLVGALVAWVALVAAQAGAQDRTIRLLNTTTVTTAATVLSEPYSVPLNAKTVSMQAKFVYGSGGTTAKAYVQTTFDHGATWVDIAAFAFTTATATKINSVRSYTAVAAAVVPTDGTLTDDTIKDGLIGERLRVKLISVGTYAGGTTLIVSGRVD